MTQNLELIKKDKENQVKEQAETINALHADIKNLRQEMEKVNIAAAKKYSDMLTLT